MIEKVRERLTTRQALSLIEKLNNLSSPFVLDRRSVFLREIKEGHPTDSSGLPLAVGFIGNDTDNTYCAELVNTEYEFFKEPHKELREIYLSI